MVNRVGMALGFNFFPPAGDLAISSNWLCSKWSYGEQKQGYIDDKHTDRHTKTNSKIMCTSECKVQQKESSGTVSGDIS